MYRYIASCVVLALLASTAHGVVVTASSQTTPHVVSSIDLLQSNLSSTASTGSFTNFGAAGLPVLVNGVGGSTIPNDLPTTALPGTNAFVTYSLNIAQFPQGYELTSINTYGAWDEGRDRQDVSISFSTVADPAVFTPLSTYQFDPTPGFFSQVSVTPDVGQTFVATGVAAVRFTFPTQENGASGYRELDVLGAGIGKAAFVPVPLQNATAFGSQPGFAVGNLLDNNAGTGWADDLLQNNGTPPNTAVFETVQDVTGVGELTFSFSSGGFGLGNHTAGKFRLSVTSDDRSLFADGLANGGDVDANWTVLDITSATSSNPTTLLTELADGSILASGANAALETYTVTANTSGLITGFRLEMLEDASLPNGGPGRAGNGNYVIFDFAVAFNAIPEPTTAMLAMIGAAGLMLRRRRVA